MARLPGFFNDRNYYSFGAVDDGVAVFSECCGDVLDVDAARELRDLLNVFLEQA